MTEKRSLKRQKIKEIRKDKRIRKTMLEEGKERKIKRREKKERERKKKKRKEKRKASQGSRRVAVFWVRKRI